MRYMDLEADVEQFGAADVEQLSWKNLLDGYSCTECGRCTAACPANITGKPLSPRKIVVNTRQRLMEKGPVMTGDRMEFLRPALLLGEGGDAGATTVEQVMEHRLIDTYITEEELWACMSCRSVSRSVRLDRPARRHQPDAAQPRAHGVAVPRGAAAGVPVAERNGSPWAFQAADRAAWAGRDAHPDDGRAGGAANGRTSSSGSAAWDRSTTARRRSPSPSRASSQACDIRFAILGQEESCHGDPARRMGNEYLYQMLAKGTIETLDRYAVRTIVTHCPHCFHQLGNEFPQFGGNYEVIHHSTYIERLLQDGRVPLKTDEGQRLTVAYHDSCYLGRYNDVYDAPREMLKRALPVITLVDPPRARDRGLCCGAGGGRMWMEERTGKRINAERTEERSQPARIRSPWLSFCMTVIRRREGERQVPVLDISEVVAGCASSLRPPSRLHNVTVCQISPSTNGLRSLSCARPTRHTRREFLERDAAGIRTMASPP